jgi:hypothetical protein
VSAAQSRQSPGRGETARSPLVAVAGESENDRAVVTALLGTLLPDEPKIVSIRGGVSLRDATGKNLFLRVDKLVKLANAFAAKEDEQGPQGGAAAQARQSPSTARTTARWSCWPRSASTSHRMHRQAGTDPSTTFWAEVRSWS